MPYDSDTILKTPPTAIPAEQSVLGAIMLSNTALDGITLTAQDFYRQDHQAIFQTICELHESGSPCDAVTVGEHIPDNAAYLTELASTTPSAANIQAYADLVKQAALKRRLIEVGTEIVNHGFNGANPSEITDAGIAELLRVAAEGHKEHLEPLDLFADHSFPTLRHEWLPPGVAAYAKDQAEIIGMPFDMMAMGCLSTISAALSDNFGVQVKRNEKWCERGRLWIMMIAEPGMKKSLAVNLPMKPLLDIQDQLTSAWAKNMAEYEKDMAVYREMAKAYTKRKAKDEGHEDAPPPPERPENRVVMINNATTEKLGELLIDNPRGIHWYSDELCVWFGMHDAYRSGGGGGIDRGMALKAYDGGPYRFDRVGRGSVIVPNFSYSLVGTTQPDKIKAMVQGMSDDGLLQRFITIEIPKQTHYGESDRLQNVEYALAWKNCIETIWHWGLNGGGGTTQFDDEAEPIRKELFEWITRVAASDGLPASMRGHISKWEGMFPRLCLLYHAFGCAQMKVHINSRKITASTAQRVIRFMKGYMLPNALRFYGDTVANSDPTYLTAKRVASMILGNTMSRVTNRDLQRAFKAWRSAPEWQKKSVITLLKQSQWLRGDGINETGWTVNPAVHRLYAERAAVERERRAEVTATLAELREIAEGRV